MRASVHMVHMVSNVVAHVNVKIVQSAHTLMACVLVQLAGREDSVSYLAAVVSTVIVASNVFV